jgi:hypothetical protein
MTLSSARYLSLLKILSVFSFVLFSLPAPAAAVSLDPYPVYDSFHDESSISFFREERPNFFWVNTGVPDAFFSQPQQISTPSLQSNNVVYAINGMEYGVRLSHWITDQWRVTGTIPFEANALVDASGNTQTVDHFGDMEIGSTFLVAGVRQKGNFIGVDGWYRFATGTNPFTQAYPLLSSGKGAPSEALGVVSGQRLWNLFSFYESFHYETTQPIQIAASNATTLTAGTFQWPDNVDIVGRIEMDVLQKAQRQVTLFYQYSGRLSGLMTLNGQPISYGQSYVFQQQSSGLVPVAVGTTNQLFWSTGGAIFKIDKEFSAEVDVSQFPVYFIQQVQNQPNSGLLLSISLIFRPF